MDLNNSYKESTLAFPFKISAKGMVSTITSQEAIWASKVRSVIGTMLKERVMIPEFGSRLNEIAWNTETFSKEKVQGFVQQAFTTWLPLLSVSKIDVSDIDSNGQINIFISYLLPNNKQSSTSVGVVGISGNLPITQETK